MSAIDFHTLPSEHGSRPRSLFGYDVIDYIGQGAGSLIYVVSDPRSNQLYALKHVERKTDKHARFVDQLVNEYEVSKRLSHPNLRKALDMKETKTWLGKVTEAVLVLELFDGSPLETNPPASALEAVQIFIQVAKGLEALHQSGYVDCDLKPNNILVAADGHVKVIDFGQACKIGTVKERIQGTPDFIAPEQVKRDAVTVRTDIFNLGATLYWALAGKHIPTLYTIKRDENSFLLHEKIPTPTDLNPAVPETLSNLVMECVRINPAKRPESMADVQRRLEIIEHTLKKRQMN
ncbi:MAG TPA: serine/threonine-protein kinase [Tepidisphaeraceae bacterium]|nr:serine/threonine-protein kinase [Tepidisphaeraceae bacterium]